eukprot:263839_1
MANLDLGDKMVGAGEAKLYIAPSKNEIAASLYPLIQRSLEESFAESSESSFYIAFSGGSLPALLSGLPDFLADANVDPHWQNWHVILADERLVSSTDPDSNLGALKTCLLDQIPIPVDQIFGIDESILSPNSNEDANKIAEEYQERVFGNVDLSSRKYLLDCVLLGFGPDGHTASLFPNHPLLNENDLLVAGIIDSPKPPPKRITLTMKVLNELSKNVIFVGAGGSKAPILRNIFDRVQLISEDSSDHSSDAKKCVAIMKKSQKYPCGMIRPQSGSLVYLTDADGAAD